MSWQLEELELAATLVQKEEEQSNTAEDKCDSHETENDDDSAETGDDDDDTDDDVDDDDTDDDGTDDEDDVDDSDDDGDNHVNNKETNSAAEVKSKRIETDFLLDNESKKDVNS